MENNSLITNKIPVSGLGIHKTYEESLLYTVCLSDFVNLSGCSQRGLYMCENGITWINKEEMQEGTLLKEIEAKPDFYHKITIININEIVGGRYFVLEIIDSNILHRHLMNEEITRENEMKLTL